jgi:anaerobic carbon-monoxide dehydrogenase iron sulfur subunit
MPKRLFVDDADLCVGCQLCVFACARRPGVGGLVGTSIWVRSAGGIRKGFVVTACRACADASCARVCPVDALEIRPEGGVRLHPELCIGCRNCVGACPFGAAIWDAATEKPAICTGCGYCVDYCPYGVLSLKELARHKEEVVYVER